MPKYSIAAGMLLIVLGLAAYFGSDLTKTEAANTDMTNTDTTNTATTDRLNSEQQEAAGNKRSAFTGLLIPGITGILLVATGLIGLNESARKHAMHGAAMVGCLGAVASGGKGIYDLVKIATGQSVNARAVTFVWIMALICIGFVALCVNSFIAARRRAQQDATA